MTFWVFLELSNSTEWLKKERQPVWIAHSVFIAPDLLCWVALQHCPVPSSRWIKLISFWEIQEWFLISFCFGWMQVVWDCSFLIQSLSGQFVLFWVDLGFGCILTYSNLRWFSWVVLNDLLRLVCWCLFGYFSLLSHCFCDVGFVLFLFCLS